MSGHVHDSRRLFTQSLSTECHSFLQSSYRYSHSYLPCTYHLIMYPSKPLKALFIIANHIIATHIPFHAIYSAQLFGDSEPDSDVGGLVRRAKPGDTNIWDTKSCCVSECPKDQIQNPKDCSECVKCGNGEKPDPEQRKCIKGDCAECPNGKARDPADCKKCITCPSGQAPSPDKTKCVKDDCAACPKDKIRDASDCKKCISCPKDKVPSADQKVCEEKKCITCPKDQVQEGPDCTKCKKCGPGEKPDAQQKACTKDCAKCGPKEIRDPKDCNKCINKQKRFEEKLKKMTDMRKQKMRDLLKDRSKLFEKKRAKMQEKHNKSTKEKAPRRKQSKLRRMGRCVTLVPLVMGGGYANDVDDLFDQEFVESDDMLKFWPEGMSVKEVDNWVDEGTDSFFESEAYQMKWLDKGREKSSITFEYKYQPPSGMGGGIKVNKRNANDGTREISGGAFEHKYAPPSGMGGGIKVVKRGDDDVADGDALVAEPKTGELDLVTREGTWTVSVSYGENVPSMFRRRSDMDSPPASTTDLVVHNPHPTTTALTSDLQARCIPFCLIPIFQAIMGLLRVFAGIAVRIGLRVAGRALQTGIRVSKAANKISKVKKLDKGKEISKDANWKRCLQGLEPW
ncbi:T9SS type A sorting domain-containing protein [Apiospora arundinis]|uniref:T9SS type A sorting domain-containing protein n=1 Tax=Apiospora arundinis TaxID=335852 RepID=A0ABR2IHX8_9PEZI